MPDTFPSTLETPTIAAGHALAHSLALRVLPATTDTSMAAHLQTAAFPPATLALVTAVYFQAIATANRGWIGSSGT
jgi:hypothetical protein